MDTRELITLVLKLLYSGFIVCGVAYSLYRGLRYGFLFPRSLHLMAAVIIVIEVGILVAFPVPLNAITLILGSLLVLLPISPYIGWVLAGGPARLCGPDEMKAQQGGAPNSRPPSQLSPSPEVRSSDSLRTPSSDGCG